VVVLATAQEAVQLQPSFPLSSLLLQPRLLSVLPQLQPPSSLLQHQQQLSRRLLPSSLLQHQRQPSHQRLP
jgi:hypothetical protein